MEVLEAILTRRSVRQSQDRAVPDDLIEKLLRAAMSAPSALNGQPWQSVVITDRQLLKQVPVINPYAEMTEHAPLATQEEVASYLLAGSIRLHWLEDGEHSFKPRKASGRTETQNWQEAVAAILTFIIHLENT